ncbi:MAG: hypothetical protein GY730_04665, partial [bacterium]|nr:hypothetical protein [bacterium]
MQRAALHTGMPVRLFAGYNKGSFAGNKTTGSLVNNYNYKNKYYSPPVSPPADLLHLNITDRFLMMDTKKSFCAASKSSPGYTLSSFKHCRAFNDTDYIPDSLKEVVFYKFRRITPYLTTSQVFNDNKFRKTINSKTAVRLGVYKVEVNKKNHALAYWRGEVEQNLRWLFEGPPVKPLNLKKSSVVLDQMNQQEAVLNIKSNIAEADYEMIQMFDKNTLKTIKDNPEQLEKKQTFNCSGQRLDFGSDSDRNIFVKAKEQVFKKEKVDCIADLAVDIVAGKRKGLLKIKSCQSITVGNKTYDLLDFSDNQVFSATNNHNPFNINYEVYNKIFKISLNKLEKVIAGINKAVNGLSGYTDNNINISNSINSVTKPAIETLNKIKAELINKLNDLNELEKQKAAIAYVREELATTGLFSRIFTANGSKYNKPLKLCNNYTLDNGIPLINVFLDLTGHSDFYNCDLTVDFNTAKDKIEEILDKDNGILEINNKKLDLSSHNDKAILADAKEKVLIYENVEQVVIVTDLIAKGRQDGIDIIKSDNMLQLKYFLNFNVLQAYAFKSYDQNPFQINYKALDNMRTFDLKKLKEVKGSIDNEINQLKKYKDSQNHEYRKAGASTVIKPALETLGKIQEAVNDQLKKLSTKEKEKAAEVYWRREIMRTGMLNKLFKLNDGKYDRPLLLIDGTKLAQTLPTAESLVNIIEGNKLDNHQFIKDLDDVKSLTSIKNKNISINNQSFNLSLNEDREILNKAKRIFDSENINNVVTAADEVVSGIKEGSKIIKAYNSITIDHHKYEIMDVNNKCKLNNAVVDKIIKLPFEKLSVVKNKIKSIITALKKYKDSQNNEYRKAGAGTVIQPALETLGKIQEAVNDQLKKLSIKEKEKAAEVYWRREIMRTGMLNKLFKLNDGKYDRPLLLIDGTRIEQGIPLPGGFMETIEKYKLY